MTNDCNAHSTPLVLTTNELSDALLGIPVPAKRFMLKVFGICCPELDSSKQGFCLDALRRTYEVCAKRKTSEVGDAVRKCEWLRYDIVGALLRSSDERSKTPPLGITGSYDYLTLYEEIVCRLTKIQEDYDASMGG